MPGSEPTDPEVIGLKQQLEEQRKRIDELESLLKQNRPATQAQQAGGIGRRGLMAGGGLGLLGLLASAGSASGAADPNDSDGDLGTDSAPWDVWADGLAMVAEDVSTSTTVTKPIVRYDSALSSLTLQIDSSLEGPSGFGQPMWFLDQSGNADTNNVTVQNSSGGTVATIPAANSIFAIVWDGSEWLTDRFIPSVEASTVTTEQLTANGETLVRGYLSSNDSSTTASGTWSLVGETENNDNQNELNSSNQFVPDKTGWYDVYIHAAFFSISDQDRIDVRVQDVTNSETVRFSGSRAAASGTSEDSVLWQMTVKMVAGDKHEVQMTDRDSSYKRVGAGTTTVGGCKYAIKWSPMQL